VEVIFDDGQKTRRLPMEAQEHGYFTGAAARGGECFRYAYSLDGGPDRPDPCSLWQPEGVHRRSAIYLPETFPWTDGNWRGVELADLVFYELHVGTFSHAGTFDGVIERLPELKSLGITAIEIMPVGQFAGTRNWGYDGVYPYATQHSYGGPKGLQRLVDAAHKQGLAVFLDVIYNHFGPEGNYLSEFGPYFTDRYKTPWGQAINYDGPGSDGVRDYVLNNARMWLEEFHIDGLRLDAVHAIFDLGAKHILSEIKEVAEEVSSKQQRKIEIIAESDLNDPRILNDVARGGYGLEGQWSDDFHHAVHSLLTRENQGYYSDFGEPKHLAKALAHTFVYAGEHSPHRQRKHGAPVAHLSGERFVVAIQNHDQVGNRATGDRFSALLTPEQQRLAASLLLLSPHLPLLFMGEEYGEKHPFPFFCDFSDEQLQEAVRRGRREEFSAFSWQDKVPDPQSEATYNAAKLSWQWPEGTVHAGLRQLYQDLLWARKNWPGLRDYTHRGCELVTSAGADGVLHLIRGNHGMAQRIEVLFNLTAERKMIPSGVVKPTKRLFRSEHTRYGGQQSSLDAPELAPHECLVFGPADCQPLVQS
jgi:maltooligosyltrehalose trehalohydrolase